MAFQMLSLLSKQHAPHRDASEYGKPCSACALSAGPVCPFSFTLESGNGSRFTSHEQTLRFSCAHHLAKRRRESMIQTIASVSRLQYASSCDLTCWHSCSGTSPNSTRRN